VGKDFEGGLMPRGIPNNISDQEALEIEQAYRKACPDNFMLFAQGLIIPSATGPQLFKSCMAPFQFLTFDEVASSLHAVRDGEMPPIRRFWIERTKKASKDADLAVMITWLIAFPKRPFYAQVGAADRDQAAIVKRRIVNLLHENPWLESLVEVQRYKIVNKKGKAELDIMAADIPGSHGGIPDVLIINELSHVEKTEFIENLLDNAEGVPQGVVIIATNAGFKGTKPDVLKSTAVESSKWVVHEWKQPAPWISLEDVAEAKKRNTKGRYNRLWWGKWYSGKGDALDEESVENCFIEGLGPLDGPEPGWKYIAGLDLGVRHDHAGLVVLGVHQGKQVLRVAYIKGWAPSDNSGEVDLMDVERTCQRVHRKFHMVWFGYDPTEARLMTQRLNKRGVPMREVSFASPGNLSAMAETLVQVVEAGKLECFDDFEGRLRRDFGKFNIVEKTYGYKLEAVSDEYGHADVGTALVICLPRAVEMLAGFGLQPDDVVAGEDDDSPLSPEEVAALPDELKDIYETYEEVEEDALAKKSMKDFEDEELR
jgi:hypothetical protein